MRSQGSFLVSRTGNQGVRDVLAISEHQANYTRERLEWPWLPWRKGLAKKDAWSWTWIRAVGTDLNQQEHRNQGTSPWGAELSFDLCRGEWTLLKGDGGGSEEGEQMVCKQSQESGITKGQSVQKQSYQVCNCWRQVLLTPWLGNRRKLWVFSGKYFRSWLRLSLKVALNCHNYVVFAQLCKAKRRSSGECPEDPGESLVK